MNKAKKTVEKDEIMLVLNFRGDYLKKNIGHEIINLFQADDDFNYIYINPYGKFGKEHSGKVKSILLGQHIGNGVVKIIAKCEDLDEIVQVSLPDEKMQEAQLKDCKNISYGGVNILKIFERNDENKNQKAWVSFRTKNYIRPKEPLYITNRNDGTIKPQGDKQEETNEPIFIDYKKKMKDGTIVPGSIINRQLKCYFNGDTREAYDILNDLINKKQLWEEENTSPKIVVDNTAKEDSDKFSFLKLIRKEDDELSFSNMFEHYLSPKFGLMGAFAEQVLGINDFSSSSYEIKREWKNIDLFLEDEHNIIVIENKIKSKINGIKHDINSEAVITQLHKYVDIATAAAQENQPSKTTNFFIFHPNYYPKQELIKFQNNLEKTYTLVTYETLHKFFSRHKPQNADRFYGDFLLALEKHTTEMVDDLLEENRILFTNAISEIKESR